MLYTTHYSVDYSLIAAITALVSSVVGPVISLHISKVSLSAPYKRLVRSQLIQIISELITVSIDTHRVHHKFYQHSDSENAPSEDNPRAMEFIRLQQTLAIILAPDNKKHAALLAAVENVRKSIWDPGGDQTFHADIEELKKRARNVIKHFIP